MMACGGARIALAVVAMSLVSTVCSAQQGLRSASLPDRTPPPLPNSTPDLFLARPGTYVPHPVRPGRFPPYFGGAYLPGYVDPRVARHYAKGHLQRHVVPGSRIDPNDTRIHRAELEPIAPIASAEPTPPRVAAGPPKTFYVIPGCYAGDKPPQADRLRPGCSLSNTRTVPPVLKGTR